MSKRDYYEILGVTKSSSEAEVKKAYRQMALKYHPDKNPGDKASEEKFKEAAEAYEVLSTPDKKSRYDQFGHAGGWRCCWWWLWWRAGHEYGRHIQSFR